MTSKVIRVVFGLLIFLGAILCFKESKIATSTGISTSNISLFPNQIINKHIDGHLNQQSDLILTVFKVPYDSLFRYIQLNTDGTIVSWRQYGGETISSRSDYVHGSITQNEQENLLDSLNAAVSDFPETNKPGEHVLTLSLSGKYSYHVITCSEFDCPIEICQVFEIINTMQDSEGREVELICPIIEK